MECEIDARYHYFVMMCLSGCSAVIATPIGFFTQFFGRVKCMVVAVILDLAIFIVLMAWKHPPEAVYFITMAFWGIADAILQLELAGVYLHIHNAAYCSLHFSTFPYYEARLGILKYT